MKKYKIVSYEINGVEYELQSLEDIIPSYDDGEVRGGVGSNFFVDSRRIGCEARRKLEGEIQNG